MLWSPINSLKLAFKEINKEISPENLYVGIRAPVLGGQLRQVFLKFLASG